MTYEFGKMQPLVTEQAAKERAMQALGMFGEVSAVSAVVQVPAKVATEWLQVSIARPEATVWIVRVEGIIQAPYAPSGVKPPVFDHMNIVLDKENGIVLATRAFRK